MRKEKIFGAMVEAYKNDLELKLIEALKKMENEEVNSWEIDLNTEIFPENFSNKDKEYAKKIVFSVLEQAVDKIAKLCKGKIECLEIRMRYSCFNSSVYLCRYYIVFEKEL